MQYQRVISGIFLERPNRFLASVQINGVPEIVHVKNTGRCKELLIPGAKVYLSEAVHSARKTRYDLIAVEKQREHAPPLLINLDSQIPNAAAEEWLRQGKLLPDVSVRREVSYGSSRFDFFLDGKKPTFLEVKGVTLEQHGIARFPDAPTERGVKHLRELIKCRKHGYEAYVLFVIQMKEIHAFRPNDRTDPAFGTALREASRAGVHILAMDCEVTPDRLTLDQAVPVELSYDV